MAYTAQYFSGSLSEQIRDAIASDTDVASWVTAQGFTQLKVFLAVDEANPPGEENCPYVAIYSVSKVERGNKGPYKLYSCDLSVCVANETQTVIDNKTTYDGMLQSSDLCHLAENALYKLRGVGKIYSAGDTLQDTDFPMFWTDTEVFVEVPKNFRGPIAR